MNCNKSYFEKYDNEINIDEKNKDNLKLEHLSDMILFQNKVEELLLKLKFINSIYKQNSINEIINIIDVNNEILIPNI